MQAEGGLMSVTGAADGPAYRVGVAIADLVAGLLAAQGIVLALYSRDRTGRGQQVDVGMLDGVRVAAHVSRVDASDDRDDVAARRQPSRDDCAV
jgi:crotonobetainyl-CoA:carnitine CoA-transferase CaiB-like acyl-CoA transferase